MYDILMVVVSNKRYLIRFLKFFSRRPSWRTTVRKHNKTTGSSSVWIDGGPTHSCSATHI